MLGLIVFFYEAGFLAVGLGVVLDWLVSLAFHYDTAKYWLSHWMRVVAGLVMVICANVFVYYLVFLIAVSYKPFTLVMGN